MTIDRVGIVGAGLIGTSVGLALTRTGVPVLVTDADADRAAAAAALGAGAAVSTLGALAGCTHVVVAVPPAATGAVVSELQRLIPEATVSDVASVKANVQGDVETLASHPDRFCGGHPIAGRERGGPGAAQPELFENATWVVTPAAVTAGEARADAVAVAQRCGARVVELDPDEHDAVLAVASHAPQLVASALAAALPTAGPRGPALAGPGFRDTTRLADGDPDLWADITALNARHVAAALRGIAGELTRTAAALDAGDARAVRDLVARGRAARATLPGKSATPRRGWAAVGVVLEDRPGELARVLGVAGDAGVNVEDLAIEHSPDHPVGFVDLAVTPDAAEALVRALRAAGWHAHRTT